MHKERTAGDAAVDGLLGGLAGGVAMTLFLLATGLLTGTSPADVLSRFAAGEAGSPLAGATSHLAVSSIYGALFGLLARPVPLPRWGSGLLYGMLLFLAARFLVLPGTESPLREIPALHFALAHAVYGLVLGWSVQRAGSRGAGAAAMR